MKHHPALIRGLPGPRITSDRLRHRPRHSRPFGTPGLAERGVWVTIIQGGSNPPGGATTAWQVAFARAS